MIDLLLSNITLVDQERLRKNLLVDIPEQVSKDEVLSEWEKRTALAVVYTDSAFAYRLLLLLRKLLTRQEDAVKLKYKAVLTWLYYAAFINLAKEGIVDFFHEGDLSLILMNENYSDLIVKTKSRLLLEPLDERDSWREQIYNTVHENASSISRQGLQPAGTGTIANWLKSYDSQIGLAPAESLNVAQFASQATIAAKLSEEERIALQRLLDFYEFIKLSSYDARGFEEDIVFTDDKGKTYLLADGKQIDLDEVEKELKHSAPQAVSALRSTPAQPQENRALSASATLPPSALPEFGLVNNQSRAMLLEANGDIKQILNKLDAAAAARSVNQALAALLLLAQLRRLDDVLADDERFRALVAEDLKRVGQDAMLEGFRLNPTAPNFLARFLKIVLLEKLGLPESDAFAFVQKLIPVLALEGEKYTKIIIDDGRGGRKWNL